MDVEVTLLIVANFDAARFFWRLAAKAPLVELSALVMKAGDSASTDEALLQRDMLEGEFDTGCRQRTFLAHVNEAIERTVEGGGIDRLALFAPPPALCAIRDKLSHSTRRLLACEVATDLVATPIALIESRLREHCGHINA